MCDTQAEYKHGDTVWVKLGGCWWPGETTDFEQLEESVKEDLQSTSRGKLPFAIVKFFQEDSYEYVRKNDRIFPYNCSKKDEFIKKGLDMHRAKKSNMEKFPEDVVIAEKRTDGDENIINHEKFQPPQKKEEVKISDIFGTPKVKNSPKPVGRSKGNNPSSAKKTPARYVTHPRFTGKRNDHQRIVMVQQKKEESKSFMYKCIVCGIGSSRVDAMALHMKIHLKSDPLFNDKRKKVKKRGPRKNKIPQSKTNSIDEDLALIDKGLSLSGGEISDGEAPEKKKRRKRKRAPIPVEPEEPAVVKKAAPDITNDLLAEWGDDDDDDDDDKSLDFDHNNIDFDTTANSTFSSIAMESSSPKPAVKEVKVTKAKSSGKLTPNKNSATTPKDTKDKEQENGTTSARKAAIAAEKLDMDFTSLWEATKVPELPKTTNEDSKSGKSAEVATKLTNPKKRFVKSFEDFELSMRGKEQELIKDDKSDQSDESKVDSPKKVTKADNKKEEICGKVDDKKKPTEEKKNTRRSTRFDKDKLPEKEDEKEIDKTVTVEGDMVEKIEEKMDEPVDEKRSTRRTSMRGADKEKTEDKKKIDDKLDMDKKKIEEQVEEEKVGDKTKQEAEKKDVSADKESTDATEEHKNKKSARRSSLRVDIDKLIGKEDKKEDAEDKKTTRRSTTRFDKDKDKKEQVEEKIEPRKSGRRSDSKPVEEDKKLLDKKEKEDKIESEPVAEPTESEAEKEKIEEKVHLRKSGRRSDVKLDDKKLPRKDEETDVSESEKSDKGGHKEKIEEKMETRKSGRRSEVKSVHKEEDKKSGKKDDEKNASGSESKDTKKDSKSKSDVASKKDEDKLVKADDVSKPDDKQPKKDDVKSKKDDKEDKSTKKDEVSKTDNDKSMKKDDDKHSKMESVVDESGKSKKEQDKADKSDKKSKSIEKTKPKEKVLFEIDVFGSLRAQENEKYNKKAEDSPRRETRASRSKSQSESSSHSQDRKSEKSESFTPKSTKRGAKKEEVEGSSTKVEVNNGKGDEVASASPLISKMKNKLMNKLSEPEKSTEKSEKSESAVAPKTPKTRQRTPVRSMSTEDLGDKDDKEKDAKKSDDKRGPSSRTRGHSSSVEDVEMADSKKDDEVSKNDLKVQVQKTPESSSRRESLRNADLGKHTDKKLGSAAKSEDKKLSKHEDLPTTPKTEEKRVYSKAISEDKKPAVKAEVKSSLALTPTKTGARGPKTYLRSSRSDKNELKSPPTKILGGIESLDKDDDNKNIKVTKEIKDNKDLEEQATSVKPGDLEDSVPKLKLTGEALLDELSKIHLPQRSSDAEMDEEDDNNDSDSDPGDWLKALSPPKKKLISSAGLSTSDEVSKDVKDAKDANDTKDIKESLRSSTKDLLKSPLKEVVKEPVKDIVEVAKTPVKSPVKSPMKSPPPTRRATSPLKAIPAMLSPTREVILSKDVSVSSPGKSLLSPVKAAPTLLTKPMSPVKAPLSPTKPMSPTKTPLSPTKPVSPVKAPASPTTPSTPTKAPVLTLSPKKSPMSSPVRQSPMKSPPIILNKDAAKFDPACQPKKLKRDDEVASKAANIKSPRRISLSSQEVNITDKVEVTPNTEPLTAGVDAGGIDITELLKDTLESSVTGEESGLPADDPLDLLASVSSLNKDITVVPENILADGQVEIAKIIQDGTEKIASIQNVLEKTDVVMEKMVVLTDKPIEKRKEKVVVAVSKVTESPVAQKPIILNSRLSSEQESTSKLLDILTDNKRPRPQVSKPQQVPLPKIATPKFDIDAKKPGPNLKQQMGRVVHASPSLSTVSPSTSKNKPTILSDTLIRPADSGVSVQKVKRPYDDIEDIDTFIITKHPKKAPVEETEVKKPVMSVPVKSKPKILEHTIITAQGQVLQPISKVKKTIIQQQTIKVPSGSAKTVEEKVYDLLNSPKGKEDDTFDIDNMPIVMGDQLLTDNIESMVTEATKPVVQQVVRKPVQQIKPIPKQPVSGTASNLKTTPTSKTYTKFVKGQRVYQSTTTAAPVIVKHQPTILASAKQGKFVVVPSQSTVAPGSKYTVGKRQPMVKKQPAILTQTKAGQSVMTSEPSGNKVMIVTNNQGQQQRVLLTPEQQKLMGYQQPVKRTVVKTTPAQMKERSKIFPTSSPGAGLIAVKKTKMEAGKMQTPQKVGQKFSFQGSLPHLKGTPGQTRTVIIKNQQGEIVNRIHGTSDEDIEKQVTEQLEAINRAANKSKTGAPVKRIIKKAVPASSVSDASRVVHKISNIGSSAVAAPSPRSTVPPLAPITPAKKIEQVPHTKQIVRQAKVAAGTTRVAATTSAVGAKTEVVKPADKKEDRPPKQLVIQDALGNETTIMEGQILALPSETVDGQPQSYMLVTLDESGSLTPLNNEALMSLDLNLGGDLSNMVLQIEGSAASSETTDTTTTTQATTTTATPKKQPEVKKQAVADSKPVSVPVAVPTPQVPVSVPVQVPEVAPQIQVPELPQEEAQILEQQLPDADAPSEQMSAITCSINKGDMQQNLIITGDPVATQKFLESLTEGNPEIANLLAHVDGQNILIHTDGQQILINSDVDNQMLMSLNSQLGIETPEDPAQMFASQATAKNQDILAAALADTDVFQQEQTVAAAKLTQSQLSPGYPMAVNNVLETSTVNSPIMTPLEVPSANAKVKESDVLNVPKNVDLPITITDPNIAQSVANQQVNLLPTELSGNIELPLTIPDVTTTSTEMSSPSFYSLPSLDDGEKFTSPISMPLLTEDPEEVQTSTIGQKLPTTASTTVSDVDGKIHDGTAEYLLASGDMCTMTAQMSSLSEPPPDMFDFPVEQSFTSNKSEFCNSSEQIPTVTQAEVMNEASILDEVVTRSPKRGLDEMAAENDDTLDDSKRAKLD